ncbi:MAG TPA: LytR C-terminal domain-containing protein [Baekduia sp.]|nr:LytR C-terminal domain-containing protein [Baekduia sp.]
MPSILALSVTDKIEQYGAYAGFAAVLGLAVLSLLYFAQAREVKRLREWAGRAPERAAEVQADAQRRAAPAAQAQPAARPQPVAQPQQPGQPQPPRPAGAPAPATAAAQAQQPSAPGAPVAAPGAGAPATAAAGAAAAAASGQPTTVQPAVGGPNGPGGNGVPPAQPGQPLRVPPGSPGARTPAGATSARRLAGLDPEPQRSRGTLLAIAGSLAALVVVVLVLVFVVFGGGDGNSNARQASSQGKTATAAGGRDGTSTNGHATTAPSPGSFTTAVLNGTTVPGLARGVANRLEAAQFQTGTVTNALDQTRSQTLVEYKQGHKREGLLVAKAIDVGADAVQPMSSGTQTIAGSDATVVVTVGADQNQPPQQ